MNLKRHVFNVIIALFLSFCITSAHATMQWANNATSVIANVGGITAGALSLTVTTGHGDRFPAVSSPDYFMVTLVDTSGNREIVKVTSRVAGSNTMTIVRAQESTSARAFAQGSLVELRLTKAALDELSKAADINGNVYVADPAAADQGATVSARSAMSLCTAIGASKNATIVFAHSSSGNTTTYTVGQNADFNAVCPKTTFKFERGAVISHSTFTLNIPNRELDGIYQWLSGTGSVTLSGNISAVYPDEFAVNTSPGTTDMAAAINAADDSVSGATVGNTVSFTGNVKFLATTYRANSQLTYRGAPWKGSGRGSTIIDYYGGTTAVNAVGTDANRKILSISDLTINGSNATAGTNGLAIGHNHRSNKALSDVTISGFTRDGATGGWGIYQDGPLWILGFYDVFLYQNTGGGYGQDGVNATAAYAMTFYNLVAEQNGYAGSGRGGAIHEGYVGSMQSFNLYGGTMESNIGQSELYFLGGQVHVDAVYFETVANAVNGVTFQSCQFSFTNNKMWGIPNPHAGKGIVASDTSIGLVSGNNFNTSALWTGGGLSVEDTAQVTVSGKNPNMTIVQASGASVIQPGTGPILNSFGGTTASLAQNAEEAIISSTVDGQSYLIFAHGGVASNLSDWSGVWLVTVQTAPVVWAMGTFTHVNCTVSGMNIQIKNLNASDQAIYWTALRIR